MDNRIVLDNTYYELAQREIYKAIWIGIPIDFSPMGGVVRMIKYPNISNLALIFTNIDTTCNIIFNLLGISVEKQNLADFVEQNIKIVMFQLSSAEIIQKCTLIENANYPTYKFSYKLPCLDYDCYNEVFYIMFRKSMLVVSMNCLDSKKEDLTQLFNMIIETLENKEGL